jgi:hypothetical protein
MIAERLFPPPTVTVRSSPRWRFADLQLWLSYHGMMRLPLPLDETPAAE